MIGNSKYILSRRSAVCGGVGGRERGHGWARRQGGGVVYLVVCSLGSQQLVFEDVGFELGDIPLAGDLLLQALVSLHRPPTAVPRHHLVDLLHPHPSSNT